MQDHPVSWLKSLESGWEFFYVLLFYKPVVLFFVSSEALLIPRPYFGKWLAALTWIWSYKYIWDGV